MTPAKRIRKKLEQGQGPPIQFRSAYLNEELDLRRGLKDTRSAVAKRYLIAFIDMLNVSSEAEEQVQFSASERKILRRAAQECVAPRMLWAQVSECGGTPELVARVRSLTLFQIHVLIDQLQQEDPFLPITPR